MIPFGRWPRSSSRDTCSKLRLVSTGTGSVRMVLDRSTTSRIAAESSPTMGATRSRRARTESAGPGSTDRV
jgi:hypothetical protein